MRVDREDEILAPEFPPRLDWLGVAFLRMDQLLREGPVLVEFWDHARINSLRTLPYMRKWHERYRDLGLRVIGVHSPGYSFGRERDTVAAAVERLEVNYPVVLDPDLAVWRLYGNKGWPARYLFEPGGHLRYIHYGEGDYADCEIAIQECLHEAHPSAELPPLVEALRPEDEPGVMLAAQTADIALPGERDRVELVRDWTDGEDFIEARDAGAAASVSFSAGGAYAVLSGTGVPGPYETDGTVVAESPGLRLHGFQFIPAPPA